MKLKTLHFSLLCAAVLAASGFSAPPAAEAQMREQNEALKGLRQGRIMPLRAIENQIVPKMRGFDYLGPEFDAGSLRYRLKFIREGRVVWIDVDARTGRIIGHSGH